MGMYTQLHLGAQLKKDTPQPVIDVLSFMFGERETHPEPLPDHALFRTPRWSLMLRCDSYYFDYKTTHHFEKDDIAGQFWLNVTTNLKNYESEIEAFMDWITPYLDAMPGDFLGYSRYEEEQQPTLLFMPESPRAVAAVDPDAGGIPMTTPEQPEQETLAEAHLDDLLLCQQILAADMTMQPDTEPLPTPNRSIPVGTVAFALYGAIQELRSHRKELASIHKLARVEGIEEAVSNAALGDVQRILKLTTARASLRRELKQAEADLAAVRAELAQVKQERDKLKMYVKHASHCRRMQAGINDPPCTCGLDRVQRETATPCSQCGSVHHSAKNHADMNRHITNGGTLD